MTSTPCNAALRRLGFSPNDRVAIIHSDDLGLCDGSLAAFAGIYDLGFKCSGSLMAPASRFLEAAAWAARHPDADIGLHLTLTSEWLNHRWRPLSFPHPRAGLTDRQGFLHQARRTLALRARPNAVLREMKAQFAAAAEARVAISHIDAHMRAAMHPHFLPDYLRLALDHRIPALVSAGPRKRRSETARFLDLAAGQGLPIFDHISVLRLRGAREAWVSQATHTLDRLPTGLSCLLAHPSRETEELRSIVPRWEERVADYEVLANPTFYQHAADTGLHLIQFDDLRRGMRGAETKEAPGPSLMAAV